MTNRQYEMASICFAIVQKILDEDGFLEASGKPKKSKNYDELDSDTISIYNMLAGDLRGIREEFIKAYAEKFNRFVKTLGEDYLQNSFLTAAFLLDRFAEELPYIKKYMYQAKTERIIAKMKVGIGDANVVRDSSYLAENILRRFDNLPELTRAMREDRLRSWRK
jgi:hypothetical protein